MTLEPMLRLIAGVFVTASVLLGMFVHPYFLWFTGLRRAEPDAVGVHELVSDDVVAAARRRA